MANWLQEAIKNPGALRKAAGVKQGEKIPESRLHELAQKSGKIGQRARLAIQLRKMTQENSGQ